MSDYIPDWVQESGERNWPRMVKAWLEMTSNPTWGMGFAGGGGMGGMVKTIGSPGAAVRLLQSWAPGANAPRASLGLRTTPSGLKSIWDIKGNPKGIIELIRHISRSMKPEEIDALRIGSLMPKSDIYHFAKGVARRSSKQFPGFAKRLDNAAEMAKEEAFRYGVPWNK